MQNFPLTVTQNEIHVFVEGLDLLLKKKGVHACIATANLLIKMQEAQPIVEAAPEPAPVPEPPPTTADEARAVGNKLKAAKVE